MLVRKSLFVTPEKPIPFLFHSTTQRVSRKKFNTSPQYFLVYTLGILTIVAVTSLYDASSLPLHLMVYKLGILVIAIALAVRCLITVFVADCEYCLSINGLSWDSTGC